MGDQISWEQLLDRSVDAGEIWIVSEDTDYYLKIGEKTVLVPILARELSAVRGVTVCKHYDNLAKFFEDFRVAGLIPADRLPKQDVVEAAKEEIRQDHEREALRRQFHVRYVEAQWPPDCPKSPDGQHLVRGAALYPSQIYGERTFQGPCVNCGAWVDTGELFD